MKNSINQLAYLLVILLFSNCDSLSNNELVDEGSSSSKTIILAVDGGGIKGIIPATFIQAIEQKIGKPSYQLYDLIGGTSTGGIISVALTSPNPANGNGIPFTADQIVDIYKNDGDQIFVAQGCYEPCATYYASHNGEGIEPYLQKMLGNTLSLSSCSIGMDNLSSARVKQMFTTSYTVNSGSGGTVSSPVRGTDYGPYLFNWYDALNTPAGVNDYYAWEAARGTSAAPTYFPVAHVGGSDSPRSGAAERWVIDGGTMSNDPAVWGVTEAFRTGLAKSLDDIIVISLGTGIYPGNAGVGLSTNTGVSAPGMGNWSETPWVLEDLYNLEGVEYSRGALITIILDAVQMVSDSQLSALRAAGLQYYRLEPILTAEQSPMDSIGTQHINSLIQTADNYLLSPYGDSVLNAIVTVLQSE